MVRWNIVATICMNGNAYMGNPTVSLDLTLSDFKRQIKVKVTEMLKTHTSERSQVRPNVTVNH